MEGTDSEKQVDERDLTLSLRKLDLIKELRNKQDHFQRIQSHLRDNVEIFSRESRLLRDFRKELDLLMQERMSHIEELRLIHADINIMETTIKQAEEEKLRAIQDTRRLAKDYHPIREQIQKLRETLSLERLPDNEDEEATILTMQLMQQQVEERSDLTGDYHEPIASVPFVNTNNNHSQQQSQQAATVVNQGGSLNGQITLHQTQTKLTTDRTFRQQPPPMKTCTTCQQQIHRNAPICPICKAKSRSRNPKKPKRKREGDVPQ
ncbi:unnamed protein product [Didymodactylos carnosus]|uniref:C4H2-type domain-containing protein n=1 Tax=Didymodactylos carnosus TaxID=1234261 RepID=A0A813RQ98_9BILA|nr:unnamed protein product [Didymodactylos carnosus]CAF0785867.1 unnamed protein product [Didymodactylos carnosus]CAF3540803.1 unnamed protein product [Didymodactylos carnosus]CAF3569588.1 unnamed protein product [Didymodactylos carnosus]